ncbi:hypothetical protein T8K17_05095 [Thalassobaculum sp. OXR-137]|uniref:hypothetical protein n=1 Tax=Thalassobaculum sp. OXR-137 TaxID=3100173 RepID=UPI002AC8B68E|nr:hypothetical protein [Thalassobaculum sp. OXR-137]WPZ35522.1 hypothetical protein T8K17_05095 [Thalassobaculum sp. OXR-137]
MIDTYLRWSGDRWIEHKIADGTPSLIAGRIIAGIPSEWPLWSDFDDREALAEAAAEIQRLRPTAKIVIAPQITGRGGLCDGRNIYIGASGDRPVMSTFHHEVHHLLANKLPNADRLALARHGGQIRQAWAVIGREGAWEAKPGEAEAEAYSAWRCLGPTAAPEFEGRQGVSPSEEVIETWLRMLHRSEPPAPVWKREAAPASVSWVCDEDGTTPLRPFVFPDDD